MLISSTKFQLRLQLCSKIFMPKHNNHKNIEGKMREKWRGKGGKINFVYNPMVFNLDFVMVDY